MTTRSLVTGACGFVGRHLTRRLVERGDTVIATDIGNPSALSDVATRITFVKADLRDADAMKKLCADVDVVFHCASVVHTNATMESLVWDINYGGAMNINKACMREGGPRIVYVSSASAVYEGKDVENGDESMPYSSISQASYADSKIAAEKATLEAAKRGEIRACSLRPHVIFGPEDQRLMPNIVLRARQGRLIFSVGRERKLSDFTYIDNLIDALLLADEGLANKPDEVNGEAFFITNGEPMGFWDFVGEVLAEMKLPPIRAAMPYHLAYAAAAVAEGIDALRGGKLGTANGLSRFAVRYMCTHHYFSIEKARRVLGYEPKVSVREGITRTIATWPAEELPARKSA
ncbi:MAG: SDR family NAD(P)-dependent oxidoreductase [Sandaracinaceae bacterium]|nr:SDR family NAD(P)-dependent oxidoreductase [Sandaracinaceae bacterium]